MEIVQYDTSDPITIAIVSDLHINSTMGLCPPEIRLDDGGRYMPSGFQDKLWGCWLDYWSQVERETNGGHLVVILNGDLVDGDHHRTPQLITVNLETQRWLALEVLRPARRIASAMYVIRGTEAHAGKAAQDEEGIARELYAVQASNGAWSHWALRVNFSGVRFDIAHHASMGRLPWTTNNLLTRLAVEIELDYYRAGLQPPEYAIRSHNHRWGDTGLNTPVRVLALPGWQGPTAYTHRIKPGALPQIGGYVFRVERGQATFRTVNYTERTSWL